MSTSYHPEQKWRILGDKYKTQDSSAIASEWQLRYAIKSQNIST